MNKSQTMGINLFRTFLAAGFLIAFLSSCQSTNVSQRGNWSKADLKKARSEMESERKAMDELIGKKKTDAFIDCALQKVEARYQNFVEADSDKKGIEEIAKTCIHEVM